MTRIYVLFSVIGWAWAVIVFAFLLVKRNGDREAAKLAKEAAKGKSEI